MATAEQIREWRALRGRFLNALWDAEHDGNDVALVSDLLAGIGAPDLRDHQIERLVGNLSADRLIEGLTLASGPEQQVRPQQRRSLRGRGMVERAGQGD